MDKAELSINVRGRLISLSRPVVMGILNATPDSFFSGSRVQTEREIADRANQIVAEGAAMIDVGAFSTRPGAQEVSEEEEARRLRQALHIVRREQPEAVVSVDTYRPRIARQCIEEWGADIINDVSEGGLTGIVDTPIHEEERMFDVVASLKAPYILMSVQPTTSLMLERFSREVAELQALGATDIVLDPGFGFGKTVRQNFEVMASLNALHALRLPLLVGVSRKSMIWKTLNATPEEALNGTTVLNTMAIMAGTHILRVHDVRQAVEAITLVSRTLHPENP
ncbi:MAG: dihydropteroate synthase [Prevotella sp.]|nr:dihydropteroate synthase [Prevotella sp.]